MANITVKKKDGSIEEFRERGRPGGSWSNSVRYEGAFVIVSDEWDKEFAFPAKDIERVEKSGSRPLM